VNTAKREAREVFGGRGAAPLRWQDKKGELRLSAASGQPLWLPKTALNTQPHTKSPHNTVHSTKRKTVFAGSWIDGDTDAYVQHRQQEGHKLTKGLSRSRVIAEMLKERAQDDIIQRNSTLIVSMFRTVLREELWTFLNRILAINARIAWWVGQSLHLQIALLRLILRNNQPQFHQLLTDAKIDAKKDIRRRDVELGEVKDILLGEMEEGRA
jgi:hypothetical protein